MLSAQSLTSIRQDRCLFDDLSFQIQKGQIWQVEGPNGAGKTTLLKMLAGLLKPYEGTVKFDDPEQEILYLGHKAGIASSLSALENMRWWHATHQVDDVLPFPLLEKLGLVGLEDCPSGLLSAGQQRRIALSRLWTSTAKLWLLDEPFTAIDKQGVSLLQEKFSSHIENGGTIILTTHQDLTNKFDSLHKIVLEYRF
ncbi:cytochrome c biogenesis heme-transporting ATPase CcmA [Flocculibacter collagenilyticus]|uniref:cytochrome c biogenesis heme-transporting ATPase CcmA n=1 Tax=Flocculibacter collagenilyticus TaxID=2744479 RepID=UPI0018F4D4E3|nr:cytochrome c biogenesis heme-transporting ATPase CcmA [Flocculibacter collagenilyticus]